MIVDVNKLSERISQLCKEREISKTSAFIESGVGKNFQSNMKTANPTLGKLTLLANFFNVSVEYLIGETKERTPFKTENSFMDSLPPKKKKVLELLDLMTDEQINLHIALMKETVKNKAPE